MYTLSIYVFFSGNKEKFFVIDLWDGGSFCCEFTVQSRNIVGKYTSFNDWFQRTYYLSSWEFRFLAVNNSVVNVDTGLTWWFAAIREKSLRKNFAFFAIKKISHFVRSRKMLNFFAFFANFAEICFAKKMRKRNY